MRQSVSFAQNRPCCQARARPVRAAARSGERPGVQEVELEVVDPHAAERAEGRAQVFLGAGVRDVEYGLLRLPVEPRSGAADQSPGMLGVNGGPRAYEKRREPQAGPPAGAADA